MQLPHPSNEDEVPRVRAGANAKTGPVVTTNVDGEQDASDIKQGSTVLHSIFAGRITQDDFLRTAWQQKPMHFPLHQPSASPRAASAPSTNSSASDGSWDDDLMQQSPFNETIRQGWSVLTHLLDNYGGNTNVITDAAAGATAVVAAKIDAGGDDDGDRSSNNRDNTRNGGAHQTALIFRDRELLHPQEVQELYGSSLFSPYLDGCSVVCNHADLTSPWIAAVCLDLQRVFPHAYVNTYLTPPRCQAVPPHADDRDVFVIQLVGSKRWKVYQMVPIPYPYPHEQVGKEGLRIPPDVLSGPLCVDITLHAGDVLYMPRGFVHEAHCEDALSFHATVALATHDWTLAGMMSSMTDRILAQVVDFRKSIAPAPTATTVTPPTQQFNPNNNENSDDLQRNINLALDMLKAQLTPQSIRRRLDSNIENHNRRSFHPRMQRIHQMRFQDQTDFGTSMIGPHAARHVAMQTVLRAATPSEREMVNQQQQQRQPSQGAEPAPPQPRGLYTRPETTDDIMSIIARFKSDAGFKCRVSEIRDTILRSSAASSGGITAPVPTNPRICDLTLLCVAKRCVEVGAMCVVSFR